MKKLHLLLALSVGLIFVVLGVSGTALVFRGELQQQYTPSLGSDYLELEVFGVDELASKLDKRYTDMQIRSVILPQYPQDYYQFSIQYQQEGKKQVAQLFVDPGDADTSLVSGHKNPLETWIYELHSSLFLSDQGTRMVGIVGIGSLGLLLVGVALWWPGRQRLKQSLSVSTSAKGRVLLPVLHRTIGIYVAPVLIVIVISGIMLVFRQALIFPVESQATIVSTTEDKTAVGCIINPGMEDYIFVAEQQFPEAMATHIKLPRRATRPVEVTLRHEDEINPQLGLTRVRLDASCARLLGSQDGRVLSLSQTLTETVVALHNGSYFGLPGRLLYGLLGVMPLFFATSGYLIWRGRQRKLAQRIPDSSSVC